MCFIAQDYLLKVFSNKTTKMADVSHAALTEAPDAGLFVP
jgi:hypothetical protein